MAPDRKSDDNLLAKPNRAKADERAIYDMAELARQAHKPNRFRYDEVIDILTGIRSPCRNHGERKVVWGDAEK
ncbi:hypothetical protein EYZ11_013565 [Aspergillus tanneri]|uniref:Uncharacterized protein n=1 Tax=Aspergillus tanneri TaxID=1220188 RepID=A0A4S3IXC9_9EURO|nr:hypothetical protein EYZ11_013565 [Aspergillus tanneri]